MYYCFEAKEDGTERRTEYFKKITNSRKKKRNL